MKNKQELINENWIPVPEELWPKVAEYCNNDVIATEETFNILQERLNKKTGKEWK